MTHTMMQEGQHTSMLIIITGGDPVIIRCFVYFLRDE